ncbi:MAG TPA: MmgE/PrpD family protein [Burkholderiales bacterium]|nr:MmgE/PrpD family protein [Burkholderiales bacterium]
MIIRDEGDDIAAFSGKLAYGDISARARKLATDAITDCVGCALAGSGSELAAHLTKVIGAGGEGAARALLWGTDRRASLYDAALYNGAIAHALDYDDISHPAYSHPSAALVPAIFAVAEACRASGAEIVTAFVVGLETFGRLGRALNLQHYKNGWHATSTFGSLAAAAAASRILCLPEHQVRMALGIAASAASGLRANFGTMTKPLHAGYAARNGVFAALLAREGTTSAQDVLLHKFGFANTFNHGEGVNAAALLPRDATLEILTEYGLALKAYPSCAATHTAIEAALNLRQQFPARAQDISSVRVGVSEFALEPLIYVKPATPLEGKFSMHYCVAAALAHGKVDLGTFSEAGIRDAAVNELIPRIRMEVDDRIRDDREFAAVVTVWMASGECHEEMVRVALGKPARWLSESQLREKFSDCCRHSDSRIDSERAFAALQTIGECATVERLLASLQSSLSRRDS